MKPFLKWVGGKNQIIETILNKIPKRINNYYEPFLGGGSVLLAVLTSKKVKGNIYASDSNRYLIGTYQNLQKYPDELIERLQKLVFRFQNSDQKDFYYAVREKFNSLDEEGKISIKGSAFFIFLNKTCYRGIYRESKNGFNVPYGNYHNPKIFDEEHLKNISALIQRVIFTAQDFSEVFSSYQEDDFLYLDPPYVEINKTSFVGYQKEGFDHQKLFNLVKNNDILFLMSNSDVEKVRDEFKEYQKRSFYNIEIINCRRSIHRNNPASRINEVLINNYIL